MAFLGELNGGYLCNPLRFNSLRRRKSFIYLILSIKIYIRAFMADANALYIYKPVRVKQGRLRPQWGTAAQVPTWGRGVNGNTTRRGCVPNYFFCFFFFPHGEGYGHNLNASGTTKNKGETKDKTPWGTVKRKPNSTHQSNGILNGFTPVFSVVRTVRRGVFYLFFVIFLCHKSPSIFRTSTTYKGVFSTSVRYRFKCLYFRYLIGYNSVTVY